MTAQKVAPGGRPGAESRVAEIGFGSNDSTIARLNGVSLKSAAAESLRRELWIVAQAGDQVHRGYPLASEDLTRLHEAVVHILHVLQVVSDD